MKTVVISGGSGGIGSAVCKEFKANGYNTAILYHNSIDKAEQLKKQGIYAYYADVSDEKSVRDAFCRIRKDFGKISVLVNLAGVTKIAPLSSCDVSDFDKIFGVNVKGTYLCCREALSDMFYLGYGDIINISSVWGERPASCEVLYSASKGAVNMFTKSLAKELEGTGICVNALSLGFVNTPMNASLSQEDVSCFLYENDANRVVTTEEVAKKCFELVRSNVSGRIINIYGEEE